MNTALDLTLRCKYTRALNEEDLREAKRLLKAAAQHLVNNGMLTGADVDASGVLELDSWSVKVSDATRKGPLK